MNRLPEPLVRLNESLETLSSESGFANCQQVVNAVVGLLGIEAQSQWKVFTDSQGKIRSNATWFMLAEGFADRRAAYKVAEDNSANIDLKVFWMQNASKSVISWLTALTPNFEDEPFYGKKNVGIDFILPETADKVIVILTNQYVIRSLELKERLKSTHLTILDKWLAEFDFDNKPQVHKILWDSFDLEPVNKDFYKGISTFFVQLKQHLTHKNILDDKHAAIFANRLIGRIVFCWFLDKKGIFNPELKYFETEGVKATEYYHTKLETLFFRVLNTPKDERGGATRKAQKRMFPETDPKDLFNANIDLVTPFLNGGLFEEKEDEVAIRHRVDFPKNYFSEFYAFLRHYNFTTDESSSTFQQVAIDPEMLGRIFENLLAEQIEETGEQARKAKGAFYTPREIVDYMCKESLREYLKSKIPETEDRDRRLGQLLDSKAHEFRDQQTNYKRDLKPYKNEIIEALDGIKVIDPACGSGAFPMGMLHILLQCYERLEPRLDTYKSKLSIIKNNLYGVDIEPMAVEISRLRAWLSIVVDEMTEIKPLPNLDFKFVCANSLIPVPGDQDMTLALDPFFSDLENMIEKLFLPSDHEHKDSLKSEITKLIDSRVKEKLKHVLKLGASHSDNKLNEYLKNKNKKALEKNIELMNLWNSYPNIFATDQPVGFFEPRYFFPGAQDGFDIVIANPPYLKERDSAHIFRPVNDSTFGQKWHQGKMDFWYYFLHKAIDITSKKGIISFITSRYWLNSKGASKLIGRVAKELSFVRVVDIGKLKVFHSVAGYHMIAIYSKVRQTEFVYTTVQEDVKDILNQSASHNVKTRALQNEAVLKSNGEIIFEDHLEVSSVGTKPLGELYDVSQGVVEAPDRISKKQLKNSPKDAARVGDGVFVIGKEELEAMQLTPSEMTLVKPYLDPSDVGKYEIKIRKTKYLIYSDKTARSLITSDRSFRNLRRHLDKYDGYITSSNKPYGIHRPRNSKYFEKDKIVFKNMFVEPAFAIDTQNHYFGFSFSSVIKKDSKYSLEYLLGILNSEFAKQWFNAKGKLRGAGVDIGVGKLRQFPIPVRSSATETMVKRIESLVLEIISSKKGNPTADTSAAEVEIDKVVAGLFGQE